MSDNESDSGQSFVGASPHIDPSSANEYWLQEEINELSEEVNELSDREVIADPFRLVYIDQPEEEGDHSVQNPFVQNRRSFFESQSHSTPYGSTENIANQRPTRSNTRIEESEIPPLEHADRSLRTYRSNKIKMAEPKEAARYQSLLLTHNNFRKNLDVKILAIDRDYKIKDKGESEIEGLEEHLAYLESKKSTFKRMTSILIDTVDKLETTTQLENFSNLEESHTVTEALMTRWIDKLKKSIRKFEQDSVVSNKQRLECPTFEGDCLKFKTFKTRFTTFCKGFGESDKKQHLIQALKGPAATKVQDLIDQDRDYTTIWEALVSSYGNEKRIIDATCKAFYSVNFPRANNKAVGAYIDTMKNRASNVKNLGLDLDNFLAQYIVSGLPGSYKADLMSKYAPEETKITVDSIGPKIDQIFLNKDYQESDDVSCNIGTTELTAAAAGIANTHTNSPESKPIPKTDQGNRGRGFDRGYGNRGRGFDRGRNQGGRGFRGGLRGRGGGQPYDQRPQRILQCYICNRDGHIADFCLTYKQGQDMRKKLKDIGRCDACMDLEKDHKAVCDTVDMKCKSCGVKGHHHNTCDGPNTNHPGSWILKGKSNSSLNS